MAKITSISTLGWAHYTLYEALPKIVARGFKRFEIASFASYCFHLNCGSPTPVELKKVQKEYGLELVCLNWSSGRYCAWLADEIDRFVEACRNKMEQLKPLGVPMMSMHFGERNDRPDQQQQLDNCVEVFSRVGELAKQYGIRMVVELPHLYNVINRPQQLISVLDKVSSDNVGVLIDSSHWGIIGYDMGEYLSCLEDRVWHIHLRDSAGLDTGDRKQNLELTPGDGTVDFGKLASALDAAGYDGDVSLEFEYRDMTLDDIENEYDRGLKYLSNNGWELPSSVKIK